MNSKSIERKHGKEVRFMIKIISVVKEIRGVEMKRRL
jgi:hypothetical protein